LGLKERKVIVEILALLGLMAVMVLMGFLVNLGHEARRAREVLQEKVANWDNLGVLEQRERLVHYLSTSGEILP
jgi:hypothetical protein